MGVISPGRRNYGAMTIRFSRRRALRWGRLASLKCQVWNGSTGAAPRPFARYFAKPLSAAGLPYFNPHSFRNTLVRLGQEICKTPEEFKAWSQNLGHEKVLTTFLTMAKLRVSVKGKSSGAWQHHNRRRNRMSTSLPRRSCNNCAIPVWRSRLSKQTECNGPKINRPTQEATCRNGLSVSFLITFALRNL